MFPILKKCTVFVKKMGATLKWLLEEGVHNPFHAIFFLQAVEMLQYKKAALSLKLLRLQATEKILFEETLRKSAVLGPGPTPRRPSPLWFPAKLLVSTFQTRGQQGRGIYFGKKSLFLPLIILPCFFLNNFSLLQSKIYLCLRNFS